MQTAVEYIFEQLEEQGLIFLTTKTNEMTISISASDYLDIKRLAKEMEKQQIMKFAIKAVTSAVNEDANNPYNLEQLFTKTYGSKGSDENFKQFSLYEHKETITSSDTKVSETFLDQVPDVRKMVSSQTEISDEEIEKAVEQKYPYKVSDTDIKGMIISAQRGAWTDAIKWYREQLRKKI
jgi:hypothetical protein